MLKFFYSHKIHFKDRFKDLRLNVLKKAFTQLPWKNLEHLKHLPAGGHIKQILVVGIGGSSLGAKALITGVKCIFLDNIDPEFVEKTLEKINFKHTLILLISKSGETIEILSLAKYLLSKNHSYKNFAVITDNPESSLGYLAKKHSISIFISPKNVPGRFSVLSIVGLIPAYLAGVQTEKVLAGAKSVVWRDAYNLAQHQYIHFSKKKNIAVIFPYAENLGFFADWYIQLLAESIGKSKKIGITPIKAIGVKDQHSQLQLFLDGPDDKFFIFIKPKNTDGDPALKRLFNAEYEGVKKAFIKRKKTFLEISFEKLTPEIFGALFYFFELEIAFLGELFKINVENQPAVELSKRLAQKTDCVVSKKRQP